MNSGDVFLKDKQNRQPSMQAHQQKKERGPKYAQSEMKEERVQLIPQKYTNDCKKLLQRTVCQEI